MDIGRQLAGAPISWGVCGVPGWGEQLPASRVFGDMSTLGLRATENGDPGFLPDDPATTASIAAGHGLRIIGGFVPLVLHTGDLDGMRAGLRRAVDFYRGVDADVLVLAAAGEAADYDGKVELPDEQWRSLLAALDACLDEATDAGLRCVLHPHVGTVIETPQHIARVFEGSRIPFCLDTGHVLVGGGDPVELTRQLADRVTHVHLKDVDAAGAERVIDARQTFADAVDHGLFRPLGTGDVDLATIVDALDARDYDGWLVLEQDIRVRPSSPPPAADVAASISFLRSRVTARATVDPRAEEAS